MATAAANAVKLPGITTSPSVLQYQFPKTTPRLFYEKKFRPNEQARETLSQPWLSKTDPLMPPYPHSRNTTFEEANHGLYGGATIQSGHKISKGRNKGKTLRKWFPNVRVEKLRSLALGVELNIPTTARVMRTITKCGGLDEYVLGEKPARIKELGLLGWKLRWLVMKSNAVAARHKREMKRVGLPLGMSLDATFEQAWSDPNVRLEILAKMKGGWDVLKEKDERFNRHVRETLGWRVDEELEERGLDGRMHSLRVHDVGRMVVPEEVKEGEGMVLPEVERGFGIQRLEMADGTPVRRETLKKTSKGMGTKRLEMKNLPNGY